MLGEIRIYGIVRGDKVRRYSNFYVKNVRNLPLRYSPVCRCKLLANYLRLTDGQKKIRPLRDV